MIGLGVKNVTDFDPRVNFRSLWIVLKKLSRKAGVSVADPDAQLQIKSADPGRSKGEHARE